MSSPFIVIAVTQSAHCFMPLLWQKRNCSKGEKFLPSAAKVKATCRKEWKRRREMSTSFQQGPNCCLQHFGWLSVFPGFIYFCFSLQEVFLSKRKLEELSLLVHDMSFSVMPKAPAMISLSLALGWSRRRGVEVVWHWKCWREAGLRGNPFFVGCYTNWELYRNPPERLRVGNN